MKFDYNREYGKRLRRDRLKDNRNLAKILANLSLVSQIGMNIMVMVVGGVLLGRYLDGLLHTKMLFLIVFTLLGISSSFYYILKMGLKDLDQKGRKKGK